MLKRERVQVPRITWVIWIFFTSNIFFVWVLSGFFDTQLKCPLSSFSYTNKCCFLKIFFFLSISSLILLATIFTILGTLQITIFMVLEFSKGHDSYFPNYIVLYYIHSYNSSYSSSHLTLCFADRPNPRGIYTLVSLVPYKTLVKIWFDKLNIIDIC